MLAVLPKAAPRRWRSRSQEGAVAPFQVVARVGGRSSVRVVTRTAGVKFSTPHERSSQLRMKMRCEGREAVLNFREQAKSGCTVVEETTPFVQRGRIAQENSRMLHRRKVKSTSSKVRNPTRAIPRLQKRQEGVV